ncbi:biotin synthase [Denitrovibrio acetiphilus DSM 12809]|uniref:Biotin synthase n=1 Tax=Denitrovibrio acetiphilus (strain DSM 12809 / NBRC 114555 / N2460) TaxID=522772 RepID=D4H8X8_DENA2|nr:biotin synthase BioB [Denitrovibrio acetiphilus]ADD68477.1 biotin synthase [Denitrovibrio acetiphilus DSM 12809]
MIRDIYEKIIAGGEAGAGDVSTIVNADLDELLFLAEQIKKQYKGIKAETCAIINARSGLCSEDCSFCAQSSHFSTGAPVYGFIDMERIDAAAKDLAAKGVKRFSIVTSGIGPNDEEFQKIKEAMGVINKHGLLADASVGCLSYEQLIELKEAGMTAYHHNLEVARSYFPEICSTHDYERDVETVRDSVRAGVYVCCGGIFGLGESWAHRAELAFILRGLNVDSVPINFLNPIKGTPMDNQQVLSEEEALRIVAMVRFILPKQDIRICGGRSIVFRENSAEKLLRAGANALMVGDYLTVKGVDIDDDMRALG